MRAGFAAVAVAAFLLRFGSSWWLTTRADTRRFDPHGFGLLGDAVLLAALALPLAGLLGWVLWRRRVWRGLFAAASRPGWTVVSVLLLLLLGAPTLDQVWAMVLLPPGLCWPAVVSAVLWFAVVAVGRALAVGARPQS